ncbi:hemophore-related protein [Nocardia terpenica]|uniref:hemophore-related protein n=1 Tax=Nocardia terpenica TaxID=455432 RepID=UPI001895877B|nr:hemophore-related protein [Nocardia terpenica]MBF6062187.1 hemophore-related protein [Nocardia terpenica]MBF6104275.1 hemophore-related protein [Nocardia terpenica]MBF6109869.1 hemophore-related protein [Nocardia terpenica]MBF6120175.1 hemophore-related protein [Nocardia terpenica]MBF6152586.1 hemophore-related protein [Nocardia terpenica]
MSLSRARFAAATLAVGTLTTVAALLIPGTASADPAELAAPLLNSTCTFDQVDAALRDKAPQLASALDADPEQKGKLKQMFDQPVEHRRAQAQAYLSQHPDQARQAENDPRAAGIGQTLRAVADSCHNY